MYEPPAWTINILELRDLIEDILSSGVVGGKSVLNNNINLDNNYVTKSDVLNSIENNFTINRELTNNFNQELYNRVNKEIIDLASNKGN